MALFRRSQTDRPVSFDDTGGDPVAAAAVGHARAGDWRAVDQMCASITDPEHRLLVAESIGNLETSPDPWVQLTAGGQVALLTRGIWWTTEAWRIRGAGRAHEVAADAWDPFHEAVSHAADDLLRATDLDPDDPGPWARLLTAGMGLEVPKETLMDWFRESTNRAPDFYPAWRAIVSPLGKKWGGSHELMFDVARMSLTAPPGSLGPAAVVLAHHERWLNHSMFENDAAAARAYWERPDVVQEIGAAAELSVLAPVRRRSAYEGHVIGTFAYGLAFTGDAERAHRAAAARLFDELGDAGIPERPWTLRWSDAAAPAQYARVRKLCRAAR